MVDPPNGIYPLSLQLRKVWIQTRNALYIVSSDSWVLSTLPDGEATVINVDKIVMVIINPNLHLTDNPFASCAMGGISLRLISSIQNGRLLNHLPLTQYVSCTLADTHLLLLWCLESILVLHGMPHRAVTQSSPKEKNEIVQVYSQ